MATVDENVDGGGENRPSEVSVAIGVSLAEASGYLRRFCEDESGRGAPNKELLGRLRTADGRLELADEILSVVAPETPAGGVLHDWLNRGAAPFEMPSLRPSSKENQSTKKSFSRSSHRIELTEEALARAGAEVAEAEAALQDAVKRLDVAKARNSAARAYEGALVYYELAQHFGKTVAPLFAMGPAWTIMRSVSAHASDHALDVNCGLLFGKDREEAEAAYISARAAETEAMLSTLDFFSGDASFEETLRRAIADVCNDVEKRRPAAEKAGRRDRSKTKRKTELNPKARADADEVIEGLRRVG